MSSLRSMRSETFVLFTALLMSKSVGCSPVLLRKSSQTRISSITQWRERHLSKATNSTQRQLRSGVEREIVETSVMKTGKRCFCKHVRFYHMNVSGIYWRGVRGCLSVWSHNTCECLPGHIAGFGVGVGRARSSSPYVVTRQIKKMKVGVAPRRQMDAVTHTSAKSRANIQADTWLQIKCHQKNRRGGTSVCVCVWRTTRCGQKYTDISVSPRFGCKYAKSYSPWTPNLFIMIKYAAVKVEHMSGHCLSGMYTEKCSPLIWPSSLDIFESWPVHRNMWHHFF